MRKDKYPSYADLAKAEKEFKVVHLPRIGAKIAVIAPHAGKIERHTGAIARGIAQEDFSLYLFRGLKRKRNRDLHITSHRFDETKAVSLVESHDVAIAIHGCKEKGSRVLMGGLHVKLIQKLACELRRVGIPVETTGHRYPGTQRSNICNRGKSKAGVQFELSGFFRDSGQIPTFINTVRKVLLSYQNPN